MAKMPDMVITIAEAKELKPGGLYALELPERLTEQCFDSLRRALEPLEKSHGVSFMLLEAGMRISEVRPAGVDEIAEAVVRKLRASDGPRELESNKKYDEGEDYIEQLALRAKGAK